MSNPFAGGPQPLKFGPDLEGNDPPDMKPFLTHRGKKMLSHNWPEVGIVSRHDSSAFEEGAAWINQEKSGVSQKTGKPYTIPEQAVFTASVEFAGVNEGSIRSIFHQVALDTDGQPDWAAKQSDRSKRIVSAILWGAATEQGIEPPTMDTTVPELVELWNQLMEEGATYTFKIDHYAFAKLDDAKRVIGSDWKQKLVEVYPS